MGCSGSGYSSVRPQSRASKPVVQIAPMLFASWWHLKVHACISHAGVSPQPCLVLSDWLPGRKTEARMGNGAWAQGLSCRDAPARLQRATQQWALTRSLFSCPLALLQQQYGVRGARSCLTLCRPSSSLISQHTALYCTFPTLSVLAPPVLPCAGVEELHSLRTRVSLSQTHLTFRNGPSSSSPSCCPSSCCVKCCHKSPAAFLYKGSSHRLGKSFQDFPKVPPLV